MFMMTPQEMKEARGKLDLTQTGLAEQLDLTRDAIAKMEGGVKRIRRVTELAILYLLSKKKG